MMLEITNLHVNVSGKPILNGVSLNVRAGEVHAIMGPNGSGKSTLVQTIAGRGMYEVTDGKIQFDGKDLLPMPPEERARAGIFVAFQYPVEIPGVSNLYLLQSALNQARRARGETELDAMDFLEFVRSRLALVSMAEEFLHRDVNAGFSGGEKKRNEILQLAVLEPRLAILDETDSGLDIDALKTVADGINRMRRDDRGFVLVTHYQRLLEFIEPDFVHVLAGGRIVRSGTRELARELEATGYGWVGAEAAV